MAQFKQNNIELKNGQKLILDTAKAKYISYDGAETLINTTLSGVTPTGDGHLTTKAYVDSEITTATGSLTSDHGDLTGLADDDHSQYFNQTRLDSDLVTFSGTIDHNTILNNHNLTTDIDHDQLTNNHNLTTDIDHDQLTNYVSGEHFTEGNIDHTSIQNIGATSHADIDVALSAFTTHSGNANIHYEQNTIDHTVILNTHNLTTDIDHDSLLNFASNEHFTEASIDHDNITNNGSTSHSAIDTHLGRLPTPDAGDDGLFLNWDNSGGVYVFTTASGGSGEAGVLDIDPVPDNEEGNGIKADHTVDVNAYGIMAAMYIAADGNLEEADATDNTKICFCMALAAGTGTTSCLIKGYATDTGWDWTPGQPVFLDTTAGTLTQTKPNASGNVVQVCGIATHADRMWFEANLAYGEVE